LLEILIAFSIMALSLGILLKIFSGGLNTAGVAEEYNVAVQIAESLMAQVGVEAPLQQGETEGLENEKYRWRVSVRPFQLLSVNVDAAAVAAELFKVEVTVNWGVEDRQVELTTLKLAKKTL
jgi:general secretion pathway protein I